MKWFSTSQAAVSPNPLLHSLRPEFLSSHRTAAGSAQFMSQCRKASAWIATVTPQPHQHISFSPKCHPYTLSDIWASSLKSPVRFCPGTFHSLGWRLTAPLSAIWIKYRVLECSRCGPILYIQFGVWSHEIEEMFFLLFLFSFFVF